MVLIQVFNKIINICIYTFGSFLYTFPVNSNFHWHSRLSNVRPRFGGANFLSSASFWPSATVGSLFFTCRICCSPWHQARLVCRYDVILIHKQLTLRYHPKMFNRSANVVVRCTLYSRYYKF